LTKIVVSGIGVKTVRVKALAHGCKNIDINPIFRILT